MVASSESLEAARARLDREAPGYLEMVREKAAALSVPRTSEERARRSVQAVARAAVIDPQAPVASSRRAVGVVKRAVGSLMRFYILRLASQTSELGANSALMGEALCDYVATLEQELSQLRARVARLEGGPASS